MGPRKVGGGNEPGSSGHLQPGLIKGLLMKDLLMKGLGRRRYQVDDAFLYSDLEELKRADKVLEGMQGEENMAPPAS